MFQHYREIQPRVCSIALVLSVSQNTFILFTLVIHYSSWDAFGK